MSKPVSDLDLLFSFSDAMRGVGLAALRRALTPDERDVLARAIFDRWKLSRWEVFCHPDQGNIHESIGKAQRNKDIQAR